MRNSRDIIVTIKFYAQEILNAIKFVKYFTRDSSRMASLKLH